MNDAFAAAHRAHASTEGVARIIAKRGGQWAAGLLMEKELKFLGDELENPARPFIVILGGAKVSDKINVIDRLREKADSILIGGAMAYTFQLVRNPLCLAWSFSTVSIPCFKSVNLPLDKAPPSLL